MLIRSYAVLQDADQANAAAAKARAHYAGRPQEEAAVLSTAAEFGIVPE